MKTPYRGPASHHPTALDDVALAIQQALDLMHQGRYDAASASLALALTCLAVPAERVAQRRARIDRACERMPQSAVDDFAARLRSSDSIAKAQAQVLSFPDPDPRGSIQ